ncbi:hypothetical protein M0804_007919 [Polistes exclamans]|nr:hypothetical protein M0804_007919 [Polistes exclamans]
MENAEATREESCYRETPRNENTNKRRVMLEKLFKLEDKFIGIPERLDKNSIKIEKMIIERKIEDEIERVNDQMKEDRKTTKDMIKEIVGEAMKEMRKEMTKEISRYEEEWRRKRGNEYYELMEKIRQLENRLERRRERVVGDKWYRLTGARNCRGEILEHEERYVNYREAIRGLVTVRAMPELAV